LYALGLSTFAGLSTGIGGLILLLFKKTNKKLLSIALGFSVGVIIYISLNILLSILNDTVFGILFGAISGIMVLISLLL
jgi:ZIP family zinc transporter